MKKIFFKWFKWVSAADQRYCIFTLLSFGLVFLLPYIGWNPILLLWTVNAYISYREQPHSKIRFSHIFIFYNDHHELEYGVVCFITIFWIFCLALMGMLRGSNAQYKHPFKSIVFFRKQVYAGKINAESAEYGKR